MLLPPVQDMPTHSWMFSIYVPFPRAIRTGPWAVSGSGRPSTFSLELCKSPCHSFTFLAASSSLTLYKPLTGSRGDSAELISEVPYSGTSTSMKCHIDSCLAFNLKLGVVTKGSNRKHSFQHWHAFPPQQLLSTEFHPVTAGAVLKCLYHQQEMFGFTLVKTRCKRFRAKDISSATFGHFSNSSSNWLTYNLYLEVPQED